MFPVQILSPADVNMTNRAVTQPQHPDQREMRMQRKKNELLKELLVGTKRERKWWRCDYQEVVAERVGTLLSEIQHNYALNSS